MTDVQRIDKPRKRKVPKKASLLAQADKMCGQLVRARGRCEECGSTENLQWAHGFGRSYRKIRHDLRNGFCLCQRCHMRYTHNPLLWDDWLRAKWGTTVYDEIRGLALTGPRADLKVTVATLKAQITAMFDNEKRGVAQTTPAVPDHLSRRSRDREA